jgi:hypothetical protein
MKNTSSRRSGRKYGRSCHSSKNRRSLFFYPPMAYIDIRQIRNGNGELSP